jgi:pre-rRNA-processing protein TSR4
MGAITTESSLFGGGGAFGGAFGGQSFGGESSLNPFSSSTAPEQQPDGAIENSLSSLSVSDPTPAPESTVTPTVPEPVSIPSITFAPPLPAYQPPQYLSTFEEYIPRPDIKSTAQHQLENRGEKAGRKASAAEDAKQSANGGGAGGGGGGGAEQWERVLPKGVDEVFERFVNRLNEAEGGDDQVLR